LLIVDNSIELVLHSLKNPAFYPSTGGSMVDSLDKSAKSQQNHDPATCKNALKSVNYEKIDESRLEIANTWRMILIFGGMIASILAMLGFFSDERLAWASIMFWPLSFCCQFVAYLPNGYRDLNAWHEKFIICYCGLLVGLPLFFFGLTLLTHEDSESSSFEKITGRAGFTLGVIFMIIFPLMNIGMASKYNSLPEKKLKHALTEIWISLPKVCGSLLYLSSSSLRCVMKVEDSLSVPQQCANPIFPTICIMLLLTNTWAIAYVKSPVNNTYRGHSTTLNDIIALRMPLARGAQLVSFGACAVLALVLFSVTDEDGSEMTPVLGFLMSSLGFSLLVAVLIDIAEVYLKPLFFPATNKEDDMTETETTMSSRSDVMSITSFL
jgi:hypothetical protein